MNKVNSERSRRAWAQALGIEPEELPKLLEEKCPILTERELVVLKGHLGIGAKRGFSLDKIAGQLGVSRERVREAENMAWRVLIDDKEHNTNLPKDPFDYSVAQLITYRRTRKFGIGEATRNRIFNALNHTHPSDEPFMQWLTKQTRRSLRKLDGMGDGSIDDLQKMLEDIGLSLAAI